MKGLLALLAIALALLAFTASVDSIKCHECEGCSRITRDTDSCLGTHCYAIGNVGAVHDRDRGCTNDAGFCQPHAGMHRACEVCSTTFCNGKNY